MTDADSDAGHGHVENQHTLEFLTGSEVARVDDDPVLERTDIWGNEE